MLTSVVGNFRGTTASNVNSPMPIAKVSNPAWRADATLPRPMPFATRTMQELIREVAAQGTAVFYSTHILDQAERLCQRVGILNKGQLAAMGPVQELRDRLAPGGSLEDVFFEVAGEGQSAEPEA